MTTKIEKPLRMLRRQEVESRTGLTRSSLYAKLSQNPKRPKEYDPDFPRPVRISARAVAWPEHEIEAWLARQIEKSRTAA